jgi:hypothetical protein
MGTRTFDSTTSKYCSPAARRISEALASPVMEGPLPGLPGASLDAGRGPVVPALVDGLLLAVEPAANRREQRDSWYADLAGPLLVPASATAALQQDLTGADLGLRVVLVAEPGPGDPAGLLTLREARNLLLDDDRVELTGVHVPLPPGAVPGDPGDAVRALLAELDFTVPTWLEVAPEPGWRAALEALAADGAERLALRLPGTGAAPAHAPVAAVLRAAVDLDLALRVTGSGARAASTGEVMAVLCAVRAALNGAGDPELAAVLAERRPAPLASALRRMSDADAAVARAFADGVVVGDVAGVAGELAALGLVDGPVEPAGPAG